MGKRGAAMRRLISIALVLALGWSAWWWAAGWGLRQSLDAWFAAQGARGWQADYATLTTTGFPSRHVTLIAAPALADPATGAAWSADALTLDSRAVWPGHLTLRFPDTAQRLSWFDRTADLTAEGMAADLRLRPGLALEIEKLALTAGPWSVIAPDGDVIRADTLALSMQQSGDAPETYALSLSAEALSPGPGLREAARISRSLPPAFEVFTLDAQVTFDKPWDRSAIETARPQPREVDLRLAEAAWGELRLMAAGRFTVDAEGRPEGTVTVKAENWREMLAMAERSGALPPQAAEAARRSLTMLERIGGNPERLDLQLNLRGGFVALGPLPLGPAPRLILR